MVDQVAALALFYISGAEQAVLQIRVVQQIAQQTDHTGGQTVGSRCISLINTVGQKADAQVLRSSLRTAASIRAPYSSSSAVPNACMSFSLAVPRRKNLVAADTRSAASSPPSGSTPASHAALPA